MSEMLALEAVPTLESALAVIPPSPPLDDETTQFPAVPPSNESPADTYVPKAPETKTLADLAHEVANWTLHSDHDFHSYLKRYSVDLFARTKGLRSCTGQADSAHVRLKNTFNEFLMLSNNQFIENRVYDEEQEDFFGGEGAQSSTDKQETDQEKDEPAVEAVSSSETKENGTKSAAESIVSKYRSALDMGMEAMKLFVMMNDEDDKSETSSQFDTVLDIYNERPLPFIIGTREFLEDETLGLGAAPGDDSESDSDSSYVSSYSSSDSDSDSEHEADKSRGTGRSVSRYRSSSDESDDSSVAAPRRRADSDESDTNELFGRAPRTETSRRRADSDESSTSGLFGRPSVPESSLPPTSRQQSVHNEDGSNASDWTRYSNDGKKTSKRKQSSASQRDAPPPFAASTPARQQFLDSSDDESDAGLFGSAPSTNPRVFAPTKIESPYPTTGDRVADGRRSSKPLSTRRSGSFNSSSSDDSELLKSRKGQNKASPHAAPQGFRLPLTGTTKSRQSNVLESKSNVSSDSDAESTTSALFGRPASAAQETKRSSAVSVLPSVHQSRRHDSSDDSSDDEKDGLFGSTPALVTTLKPMSTPVVPPRRPMYSDSSSDDEDEGLFGAKPIASSATVARPVAIPREQRPSHSGLFGEDDSDDSDDNDNGGLFSSNPSASKPATLPLVGTSRPPPVRTHDGSDSDSDSDDGLFGQSQPSKPGAALMPTASITTTSSLTRQSRAKSDSSDSDDSGLFGAPPVRAATAAISTPAETTSASLLKPRNTRQSVSEDDSDDWSDDDARLFGAAASNHTTAKPGTTAAPSEPTPRQAPATSDSLFGPPRSTSTPVVHPPVSSAAARMQVADSDSDSDSDWDDDGGLFGPPKSK